MRLMKKKKGCKAGTECNEISKYLYSLAVNTKKA